MKKSIIIGTILTAIGLLAALIGLASGASTDLVWQNGVKIDRSYQATKKLKKFNQLTLNTDGYDVSIQTGTTFKVEINSSKLSRPTISQSNGNLTISNKQFDPINVGFGRVEPRLTITVPTGTKLAAIKGVLNGGDVNIDTLETKQVQLEVATGSLEARNLNITDNGQLTLNNGQLEVKNSTLTNTISDLHNGSTEFDNSTLVGGTLESRNGAQEFDNVTFKQVVNIKNRNGKIEIESPVTDGYRLSSDNGNIQLFGRHASHELSENATATNRIVATNRNGKIEIDD
ncbi:DUF4097 family beta strand repeat-containing protein [Paucilactobacillus wasatchensis]|uniref:DUF4097 domain-containing protein n=1 Tax=Paucilactobacillus wasatchensis TaxID=1335616 RepID=A0A0D0Y415_9LACO|nr:DUF4097 family beta strand repeat-containing protein [Paucilactobacillus wasatchensis]KIS02998.1 hypothetical protein WDC_1422 [Paucilactobacillus wasatchensis]